MRLLLAVLIGGTCALASPAMAVSGGKLGTLERGIYICEMPGDAATTRGIVMPEAGFEVTNASTYSADQGDGTYLRTGDDVTITSGPKKGERYKVEREGFLRQIERDGNETGLRCIRLGATRS